MLFTISWGFLNHRAFMATIKLKCSSQTILASTFKIPKSHLSHLKVQIQCKYCNIEFKAITPYNHISYVTILIKVSHSNKGPKPSIKIIPIQFLQKTYQHILLFLHPNHSILISHHALTQFKPFGSQHLSYMLVYVLIWDSNFLGSMGLSKHLWKPFF